jgi:hypothetical protein
LAIKYGYKVEVLESYIFERGIGILKDYTLDLAFWKENSSGDERVIVKFLLNTLYGRLGMKNERNIVKMVTNKEYEEIIKRYEVLDAVRLGEDKVFVRYSNLPCEMACEQSGVNFEEELLKSTDNDFVDNSTPIAAAIAS